MAFIRSKIVNGRKYYQVVRNYREGGTHKQEMICHIGVHPSLLEEIAYREQEERRHLGDAAMWEEQAKETADYLRAFYDIGVNGDDLEAEAAREAIQQGKNALELWESLKEEEHRLYRRRLVDYGPVEGIVDYYIAKRNAEQNVQRAALHRAKIEELRQVHRKYFSQEGMTFR